MSELENRIRPLFVIGPDGCGKSTYIEQLARKEKRVLLRCPCRKDRTLREQRARIHEWALRAEPTLLWLEGTDDLTPEAQSFLRRILETYSPNVRFCLEGRTLSSIQEPILSRCDIYRIEYNENPVHKSLLNLSDTVRDSIFEILNKTNSVKSYRKQNIASCISVYYSNIWNHVKNTVNSFTESKNILISLKEAQDPWIILWNEYGGYPKNIQNDINKAICQSGNPWAILAYARAASASS
jgi:hypothetical protein